MNQVGLAVLCYGIGLTMGFALGYLNGKAPSAATITRAEAERAYQSIGGTPEHQYLR